MFVRKRIGQHSTSVNIPAIHFECQSLANLCCQIVSCMMMWDRLDQSASTIVQTFSSCVQHAMMHDVGAAKEDEERKFSVMAKLFQLLLVGCTPLLLQKRALYTWGILNGTAQHISSKVPTMVLITRFTQFAEPDLRIGCCHFLLIDKAIAFTMGMHLYLGGGWSMQLPTVAGDRKPCRQKGKAPDVNTNQPCCYVSMPTDVVQRVVETCALWPPHVSCH